MSSLSDIAQVFQLPSGALFFLKVEYTRAVANGVLTLILTSVVSLIAVLGLLAAISMSAFNTRASEDKNLFVRTHVAAYFVSLLIGDLLQAVGSIMNAKWYEAMAVTADDFCTAQGAIKQAADVSTALWTFVLAVHTFCVLFLGMKLKRYVLFATLISGWSAVLAIVIAGPAALNTAERGPFFGVSGYWCWISAEYDTPRITLDYMIMFFSAVASFVLYSLVFLKLRGNIVTNGWNVRFRAITTKNTASWRGRQIGDNQTLVIARQMLLYPMAYTIIILPIAAARFSMFAGHDVSFVVTIFCDTVFLLSGTVNVILFVTTRRILPPRSVLGKWSISKPALLESSTAADPDAYYRSAMPQDNSANSYYTASVASFDPEKVPSPFMVPAPLSRAHLSVQTSGPRFSPDLHNDNSDPEKNAHAPPTVRVVPSPASEYDADTDPDADVVVQPRADHAGRITPPGLLSPTTPHTAYAPMAGQGRESTGGESVFSFYDAYRGSTMPRDADARDGRDSLFLDLGRDSARFTAMPGQPGFSPEHPRSPGRAM
ncbi:hypothetical protein PLICRDRAFT_172183 [Plicaturopsis crispa FD-325 SS-3]|nr:hypothetical protein PLICRDRAFT_172183 [Plicaturopsis crispa FD-325 SS-3]